jgi:hypothetical protein
MSAQEQRGNGPASRCGGRWCRSLVGHAYAVKSRFCSPDILAYKVQRIVRDWDHPELEQKQKLPLDEFGSALWFHTHPALSTTCGRSCIAQSSPVQAYPIAE